LLIFIAEPNVPKHLYSPQNTVPVYDHTVFKTSLQSLQANRKLSTCCWLRQLTVCPQYSLRWEGDDLGREKDLLLRKIRQWLSNVMSSAHSWYYH